MMEKGHLAKSILSVLMLSIFLLDTEQATGQWEGRGKGHYLK